VGSFLHNYVNHARKVVDAAGPGAKRFFRILSELGRRLDPPLLCRRGGKVPAANVGFAHLGIPWTRFVDWDSSGPNGRRSPIRPPPSDHPDGKLSSPDDLTRNRSHQRGILSDSSPLVRRESTSTLRSFRRSTRRRPGSGSGA